MDASAFSILQNFSVLPLAKGEKRSQNKQGICGEHARPKPIHIKPGWNAPVVWRG
jgi:hypothetical protein